jgi:integrase/recombinase XerD
MKYKKEFLEHLSAKGFDKETVEGKERYIDRFHFFMLQNAVESLGDVTPDILEQYKLHLTRSKSFLTKQSIAQVTVRASLTSVKQYFQYIYDRGFIFINPFCRVDMPKEIKSLPKDIPTQEEMNKILEKPDLSTMAGLRDRSILELMYSTGIRRKELLNLNVYDVNLTECTLRINLGKGKKDRVVPIGKVARHYLSRYLKEVRPKWVNGSEDALFVSKDRVRCKSLYMVKLYCREVYPDKHITCHTFRHSCATHMLRGGADIRIIQELLGHACIDSTQIYTKLVPADLKEALKKAHPMERAKNLLRKVEDRVINWYNNKCNIRRNAL